jgi:hypothetical protein
LPHAKRHGSPPPSAKVQNENPNEKVERQCELTQMRGSAIGTVIHSHTHSLQRGVHFDSATFTTPFRQRRFVRCQ